MTNRNPDVSPEHCRQTMKLIDGQKHPLMVLLADIQNERGRKRNRCFFVEGRKLTARAFSFGAEISALIVTRESFRENSGMCDILETAEHSGVETYCAGAGLIGKVLKAKPVPPCLAIVKRTTIATGDIFQKGASLVIGVEHGENPDNLGMLLRSADAAGADGCVLCAQTVDPFNRRTARGSRGAVLSLHISIAASMLKAVETARNAGFRIIASSAHAGDIYAGVDMVAPTFLIVGNEHEGISPEVSTAADAIARIPMLGKTGSLNIAVAASLLLYEARRQKGFL